MGPGSLRTAHRKSWPARRTLILLLWFMAWPETLTALIGCPDKLEQGCICDNRKGENAKGGWEISCHDNSQNFATKYRLEYSIRSYVRLNCFLEAPYRPAMFQEYNISDVDYFQFVTCPFPTNLTFGEVLEGVVVKKLKFEADKHGIYLDAYTFEGLSSLESINLHKNMLTSIPEDFFKNMTQLKSVELNENLLKVLPDKLFNDLNNLTNLQLGSNELQELPDKIFSELSLLQRLYLYKNQLTELPPGVFLGLKSLKVLDLANNRIQDLHQELFLDTPQIMHINIRVNNLTRLQNDIFHGTKRLEELDISDNKFTKLPENLLEGLHLLKDIALNNCNLKSIGEAFFSSAVNLTKINMWNNRLTSIPPALFRKNLALQEINLKYNDLLELPANVFEKNFLLKTLKITHNNLTSLPLGIFDHLTNLEHLDITANLLKVLDRTLLLQNQKLMELYASKNQLTSLQGHLPFGQSSNMKIVDLSFNEITDLSERINWGVYLGLEKLNLKNNNLTRLTIPDLFMFGTSTEIEVQNNQITSINVDDVLLHEFILVKRPTSKLSVFLDGNPLVCDCKLFNFWNYTKRGVFRPMRTVEFNDLDELKCEEPSEVSGTQLIYINPKDLVCPISEVCPIGCDCITRPVDTSIIVTCANLTELPSALPYGTREVHLENNRIQELASLETDIWENVTRLYLDNNNITTGDWVLPPRLEVLSLKGNLLDYLPQSVADYVNTHAKIRVSLGGNPWECDCETLHLKSWLYENVDNIMDINQMYCNKPVYQNGTEVRTTVGRLTEEICPEENVINNSHLITVSVICVILAVLLLIVSILYYRNKQTVIAYFYIHFHNVFVCFFSDNDLDEDKNFDAFVSYSTADRDVALELIGHLEQGDPSFKLCIHERDWLPGNLISWNIVNSVQNSRKTILVLSKHFLESVWFQVEFHTAYYQMLEDRIDRLIVIVRGDLPEKGSLDKDLQYLLSTKTFLVWGERWFWEKLRYALPHRRVTSANLASKNTLQDKSFPLKQRPNPGLLKTVEDKIASLSGDEKVRRTDSPMNGGVVEITTTENHVPNNNVEPKEGKPLSNRFKGGQLKTVPQNKQIDVNPV